MTHALCDKAWALFQAIEAEGGLPVGARKRRLSAKGRRQRGGAGARRRPAEDRRSPASALTPIFPSGRSRSIAGAPERAAFTLLEGALAPMRLAEPFERLRDLSDACLKRTGKRPKVYLAALGPEAAHRRRVAFMREWARGRRPRGRLRWRDRDGRTGGPASSRERRRRSPASAASDEAYAREAATFAAAFKARARRASRWPGRPGESEAAWRAAGVDDFIFAGKDAVAALARPLSPHGVSSQAFEAAAP